MDDENAQDEQTNAEDASTGTSLRDPAREAPEDLKPLETVAKGYKYYMEYLKNGGTSGISNMFGKLKFADVEEDVLGLDDDKTK